MGPFAASDVRTSIPWELMTNRGFFHWSHSMLAYVSYFLGSGFAIRFASGSGGGVVRGGVMFVQQQRHMHKTPANVREPAHNIDLSHTHLDTKILPGVPSVMVVFTGE